MECGFQGVAKAGTMETGGDATDLVEEGDRKATNGSKWLHCRVM